MITKEYFFNFLKENNFYEGWIEGYNLDNEILGEIPLDDFFERIEKVVWLYCGPEVLSKLDLRPDDIELQKKFDEWRNKYLSLYMDLDEKWMSIVNNEKDYKTS